MNHETGDTPKWVLDRIAGITGDDLSDGVLAVRLNASTPADAVHALSKIKRILKELPLLKRDVRAQVAAMRADFATQRAAVPTSGVSVLTGMVFGRVAVGRVKAAKRVSLRQTQLAAVKPFDDANRFIDVIEREFARVALQIEAAHPHTAGS